MELHAFNLVAAVAQAHDDAVIGFGGDGQLARQGFAFHNQRMVTRGSEGIGEFSEHSFAVVVNLTGLAMEERGRAFYLSSERHADGLMAEAYSENWKFAGKPLDKLHGDARFLWRAWPGRNNDALRLSPGDLFDADFIVAMHLHLASQLAKILGEVVGEGVIII